MLEKYVLMIYFVGDPPPFPLQNHLALKFFQQFWVAITVQLLQIGNSLCFLTLSLSYQTVMGCNTAIQKFLRHFLQLTYRQQWCKLHLVQPHVRSWPELRGQFKCDVKPCNFFYFFFGGGVAHVLRVAAISSAVIIAAPNCSDSVAATSGRLSAAANTWALSPSFHRSHVPLQHSPSKLLPDSHTCVWTCVWHQSCPSAVMASHLRRCSWPDKALEGRSLVWIHARRVFVW